MAGNTLASLMTKITVDTGGIDKSFKLIKGGLQDADSKLTAFKTAVANSSKELAKAKTALDVHRLSMKQASTVTDEMKAKQKALEISYKQSQIALANNKLELQKYEAQTTTATGVVEKLRLACTGLQAALGLGILAALSAITVGTTKTAAEFEQLNLSFEVMIGNKDKAAAFTNELINLANVTPMTTQGLSQNAKMLLSMGENVNNVIPDLKMLGDVAGGNQEKLNQLALVFGQVGTRGRLTGDNLRQMQEQGFDPLNIISKKTGESMAQLQDRMQKGEIPFSEFKQTLVDVTSKGGRFYQMMDKQSKTLNGLFSTLLDKTQLVGNNIGSLFMPAVKSAANALINMVDSIMKSTKSLLDFTNENKTVVGSIKDFIIVTTTLITTLSLAKIGSAALWGVILKLPEAFAAARTAVLAFNIASLATPWTAITLGATAVAGAYLYLEEENKKTSRTISDLNTKMQEEVSHTHSVLQKIQELHNVEKKSTEQKRELAAAINSIVAQYPKYEARLRKELELKGKISEATAEEIANEITLQKVKGLTAEKTRLEKSIKRGRNYETYETMSGETKFAYSNIDTQNYNRVNKALGQVAADRKKIVNDLIATKKLNTSTGFADSGKTGGGRKSKTTKAGKSADTILNERASLLKAQSDLDLASNDYTDAQILRKKIQLQQQLINLFKSTSTKGKTEQIEAQADLLNLNKQYNDTVLEDKIKSFQQQYAEQKIFDEESNQYDLKTFKGTALQRQELENKNKLAMLQKEVEYQQQLLELRRKGVDNVSKLNTKDREAFEAQTLNKLNAEKAYQDELYAQYQQGAEKEKDLAEGIGDTITDGLKSAIDGTKTLSESFKDMLLTMVADLAKVGIENKLKSLFQGASTGNASGGGVFQGIYNFASTLGLLSGFATGGYPSPNKPFIAGENGAELIAPTGMSTRVYNAAETSKIMGGAGGTAQQQNMQPVLVTNTFQVQTMRGDKVMDALKQPEAKAQILQSVRDAIRFNHGQVRTEVKNAK